MAVIYQLLPQESMLKTIATETILFSTSPRASRCASYQHTCIGWPGRVDDARVLANSWL